MERPSAATTRRLPQTSDCHFLGDLGPAFLPGSQRSSPTSDRPIGVEPSTPPWSTRAIQWKAISCFPGTGTGTGTGTGNLNSGTGTSKLEGGLRFQNRPRQLIEARPLRPRLRSTAQRTEFAGIPDRAVFQNSVVDDPGGAVFRSRARNH